MKKLYVSMDECCGNGDGGNLRKWITATICIMGFINWGILLGFTSTASINDKGVTDYTFPLWSVLSINLVPIFSLVFWTFTTNNKYWNEYEEKKKERLRS